MRTSPIYWLAALALTAATFPTWAGLGQAPPKPPLTPYFDQAQHRLLQRGEIKANPFAEYTAHGKPVMLAHAILVKAAPEKESTITDVPEEVLLIFNDSVGQEFLALAVIDPSGQRVDNHDAKLDFTDHSHLRASVSKLAPGRYTVRYRVLSADGHVVSGKYFFDVKAK